MFVDQKHMINLDFMNRTQAKSGLNLFPHRLGSQNLTHTSPLVLVSPQMKSLIYQVRPRFWHPPPNRRFLHPSQCPGFSPLPNSKKYARWLILRSGKVKLCNMRTNQNSDLVYYCSKRECNSVQTKGHSVSQ